MACFRKGSIGSGGAFPNWEAQLYLCVCYPELHLTLLGEQQLLQCGVLPLECCSPSVGKDICTFSSVRRPAKTSPFWTALVSRTSPPSTGEPKYLGHHTGAQAGTWDLALAGIVHLMLFVMRWNTGLNFQVLVALFRAPPVSHGSPENLFISRAAASWGWGKCSAAVAACWDCAVLGKYNLKFLLFSVSKLLMEML